MYSKVIASVVLVMLFFTGGAASQEQTCPDIVTGALESTHQLCAITERSQACYGHVLINAEAQPSVASFAFEREGDMANLGDLHSMRLSPMDVSTGVWGVTLMQVQANLQDSAPSDVIFLAFGEIEFENTALPTTLMDVSAKETSSAVVRLGPSTDWLQIGLLPAGETTTATGRHGDWIRVILPRAGQVTETGWVHRNVLVPQGSWDDLDEVEAGADYYRPMQAFYFQSNMNDAPCEEAPESGLLVQTPDGVAQIRLLVNEVYVQLHSTAFLQAQPGGSFTICALEGDIQVSVSQVTFPVFVGTCVDVALDNNLRPVSLPSWPYQYDFAAINPLPVDLLPIPVDIQPPPDQATIDALMNAYLASYTSSPAPTPAAPGAAPAGAASTTAGSPAAPTAGPPAPVPPP